MTWQPDDGKTGKLALKIAANLAVSSVMLGLPPAGCGLVISCPETHKTDVRHIFRVLQNAGCGPFIPLEGISVEEMRAVCNPDALLCWAEYDGYATGPSFVALSEAVRSHEQAYARFSPG